MNVGGCGVANPLVDRWCQITCLRLWRCCLEKRIRRAVVHSICACRFDGDWSAFRIGRCKKKEAGTLLSPRSQYHVDGKGSPACVSNAMGDRDVFVHALKTQENDGPRAAAFRAKPGVLDLGDALCRIPAFLSGPCARQSRHSRCIFSKTLSIPFVIIALLHRIRTAV